MARILKVVAVAAVVAVFATALLIELIARLLVYLFLGGFW